MNAATSILACWPGYMKRKTAAAYLDMSEAAFEREVASARLPQPIKLGGREHWSKEAIDQMLANNAANAEGKPDYLREFEERYGTSS